MARFASHARNGIFNFAHNSKIVSIWWGNPPIFRTKFEPFEQRNVVMNSLPVYRRNLHGGKYLPNAADKLEARYSRPSHAQIILNSEIARCERVEDLMDTFSTAMSQGMKLSVINISTAVNRLAKIRTKPPRDSGQPWPESRRSAVECAFLDILLQRIEREMRDNIRNFRAREMANIVCCVGKM